MYEGKSLGRRDFLKVIVAGGVASLADPVQAVAQDSSAVGGSDLVRKILGTYEGLRLRGVLPKYDIDKEKDGGQMVMGSTSIGVLDLSDLKKRYFPAFSNFPAFSIHAYDTDGQLVIYLDKPNLAVVEVFEAYISPDGTGHGLNIKQEKGGLRLKLNVDKSYPIFIPGAQIPREYQELGKSMIQDFQMQRGK